MMSEYRYEAHMSLTYEQMSSRQLARQMTHIHPIVFI